MVKNSNNNKLIFNPNDWREIKDPYIRTGLMKK